MRINTSRKSGFTLVEIMIVVAIIGLLAAIAIPNFITARKNAQAKACVNNLRQIDAAIQQWALENNQPVTATATSADITVYLGRGDAGQFPICPGGGAYTVGAVNAAPTCNLANSTGYPHILPGGSGS